MEVLAMTQDDGAAGASNPGGKRHGPGARTYLRLFEAHNDHLTESDRTDGKVTHVQVHRDLVERVDGDELLQVLRATFATASEGAKRCYNALTFGFVKWPDGSVRWLFPHRKALPTPEEVAAHYGMPVETVERDFRRVRKIVEEELRDRALID